MYNSRNSLYNAFEDNDLCDVALDRLFDARFDQMVDAALDRLFDARFEMAVNIINRNNMQENQQSRRRHVRNDNLNLRPDRDREGGQVRLWNDYFAEHSIYDNRQFRTRYRMDKILFLHIVSELETIQYFQQRHNAHGRLGFTPIQKCTAALRMLAYGLSPDSIDEYLRIGANTSRECLYNFCQGIINKFGTQYLRRPNSENLRRLLCIGELRGFPGMIGSIDCMHWEWKICPNAHKGMYQGRDGKSTLILEAVASQDLWIWHAFFRTPGSCNDLNVLYRSLLFDDILQGRAPTVQYKVNDNQYDMGYYLKDGIYSKWAYFIQPVPLPQTNKHKWFAQCQEAACKDVERAFGVLKARWWIIKKPALAWDRDTLCCIMSACIIMHNMIVEDERINYQRYVDPSTFIAEQPESSNRAKRDNTTWQY